MSRSDLLRTGQTHLSHIGCLTRKLIQGWSLQKFYPNHELRQPEGHSIHDGVFIGQEQEGRLVPT
jgi:hypothetical protein